MRIISKYPAVSICRSINCYRLNTFRLIGWYEDEEAFVNYLSVIFGHIY